LKLRCDILLSTSAFKFNLRRYTSEATGGKHRFAGIVSGSVKAGVGDNGQLGADVSFAFDTKVGRCRLTPS